MTKEVNDFKQKLIVVCVCVLSALLGIGIGYFILGPLIVTASVANVTSGAESSAGVSDYVIGAHGVEISISSFESDFYGNHAQPDPQASTSQNYAYVVSSLDGFIVVYQHGKGGLDIVERTMIPICAFPQEEIERLADGINVANSLELAKILQDYGS